MNGKYRGQMEQRWAARDAERLARMRERRECKKKRAAQTGGKEANGRG